MAQSIENAATYLTLILIFLSFGLISVLSMRSRTVRSFQFELYVFMLVVVFAEVPKIASDLGWIPPMAEYDLPGLAIHSVSMAFLAGFVLWRSLKAFPITRRKNNKRTAVKSGSKEEVGSPSDSSSLIKGGSPREIIPYTNSEQEDIG
jgi:hypothetical protein